MVSREITYTHNQQNQTHQILFIYLCILNNNDERAEEYQFERVRGRVWKVEREGGKTCN